MLSLYLDLVRFGAAVVVVLYHAWPVLFAKHPLPWPGHSAIVVFFVLSGLVIAHATDRPGLTLADYAIHRIARIWSVAIPALMLSAIVSFFVDGARLGPAGPAVNGWADGTWRILANLLPIGQIWLLDINPPLNAPFWSLNFEVWYYALFGAWIFLGGWRRALVLGAIVVVIGPKILLLFPVWLLGVLLYRYRIRMGERAALALLLASTVLALAYFQFDISVLIRKSMAAHWPETVLSLAGANQFVGDLLLAVIICANFTAAASLGRYGAPLLACAKPIRAAAGYTFSTYLFHLPLLAAAVLGFGLKSWGGLLAVALGIFVLAQVSERQLPVARRLLGRLAGRRQ